MRTCKDCGRKLTVDKYEIQKHEGIRYRDGRKWKRRVIKVNYWCYHCNTRNVDCEHDLERYTEYMFEHNIVCKKCGYHFFQDSSG